MIDTTTTTNAESNRADVLTRLDERIGNALERAVQAEDIPQPVARAIRRNKIRDIGDSIIEAKRLAEAARAHDKG